MDYMMDASKLQLGTQIYDDKRYYLAAFLTLLSNAS